ncbi:MAG TPA: phosphoenolpyruvate carboxylase [Candidatus Sulfotelmatobacter sp.]|jgi:phosphoenolpyruvate carboxylase|nr:phosphoenolpyruvate carboxylase [Candidatus Sulfotelmatobacter sp.]
MKRKIPTTMASQHPDHANAPYWHDDPFIAVQHEYEETFLAYSDLGIDEYKWDWEGKLVDESVMERLLGNYYTYFKENPLGKEKFLTFRLPNPKAETEFRLARAFINLLSAAALAKKVGLYSPPLFEVILPMTESAEEMIAIQEAFKDISDIKNELLRFNEETIGELEIIPLFEQVDTIIHSDEILEKYLTLYKKKFKRNPEYLRPYTARSDPALNSGMVPTVLAIKIALSRYKELSKKINMPLYPIIGTAMLPFRGGLRPDDIESFVNEYRGMRTALIQSAFRYDFDKEIVKEGIQKLHELLPKYEARTVTAKEEERMISLIPAFEEAYRSVIEEIAPLINTISSLLPKRRERVQHIGLFGYSRGIGKVTLPRAIGFTAALYSLGIPPELIGTGRGLQKVKKEELKIFDKHYLNFKKDILAAGRYLNKDNLVKLSKQYPRLQQVKEDITFLEKYFGEKLEPKTLEEKEHHILTSRIVDGLEKKEKLVDLIVRAAKLRRSLG